MPGLPTFSATLVDFIQFHLPYNSWQVFPDSGLSCQTSEVCGFVTGIFLFLQKCLWLFQILPAFMFLNIIFKESAHLSAFFSGVNILSG